MIKCRECPNKKHAKIQCPATGRCGECGADWPCDDHKMQRTFDNRLPLNFDDNTLAERVKVRVRKIRTKEPVV